MAEKSVCNISTWLCIRPCPFLSLSLPGTGAPVLLPLAVGDSDGVGLPLGVPVPVAVLLGVPEQGEGIHAHDDYEKHLPTL